MTSNYPYRNLLPRILKKKILFFLFLVVVFFSPSAVDPSLDTYVTGHPFVNNNNKRKDEQDEGETRVVCAYIYI